MESEFVSVQGAALIYGEESVKGDRLPDLDIPLSRAQVSLTAVPTVFYFN